MREKNLFECTFQNNIRNVYFDIRIHNKYYLQLGAKQNAKFMSNFEFHANTNTIWGVSDKENSENRKSRTLYRVLWRTSKWSQWLRQNWFQDRAHTHRRCWRWSRTRSSWQISQTLNSIKKFSVKLRKGLSIILDTR